MKRTANSAYPKVVSNLGALTDTTDAMVAIDMIRFMNHFARSVNERALIIDFFKKNVYAPPRHTLNAGVVQALPLNCQLFKDLGARGIHTSRWMHMMNDYFPVGFANTLGFAHPNTGDTMTSVMIGGLRTVMNGDFEIFPGDIVQFYWLVVTLLSLVSRVSHVSLSAAGHSKSTTFSPTGAENRTSTCGSETSPAT